MDLQTIIVSAIVLPTKEIIIKGFTRITFTWHKPINKNTMNFFIIFTLASIISCTGANLDPNHKGIELEIPSESKQKKITSKKNYLNYIKVFYKDTVSVFGKVVERELETIGDKRYLVKAKYTRYRGWS